jgi:hypothetical protein
MVPAALGGDRLAGNEEFKNPQDIKKTDVRSRWQRFWNSKTLDFEG